MRMPKLLITREHGSWVVLFVPIVVAVGLTEALTLNIVLVSAAALSAFLSYVPAQILLRKYTGVEQDSEKRRAATVWFSVFAFATAVFFLPLLLQGFWKLLPLGMVSLLCFGAHFLLTRVRPKTVLSDLIAVLGLTVGAPATMYVATGELSGRALFVWMLNFFFFGSGVVYVHMNIAATTLKGASLSLAQRLSVGFLNLVYHLVVLGIVTVLVVLEYSPTLVVMAFLPMTVHALYGTFRLSTRVQFKRLGFLLLGHAILFAIIVSTISVP